MALIYILAILIFQYKLFHTISAYRFNKMVNHRFFKLSIIDFAAISNAFGFIGVFGSFRYTPSVVESASLT